MTRTASITRRILSTIGLSAVVLVSSLVSATAAYAASAPASSRGIATLRPSGNLVPVAGTVSPLLRSARRLSAVPGSRRLVIAIGLAIRDPEGLGALLRNLYDPTSESYHHFLTTSEFRARFAPTDADRQTVVDWLQSHDVRVTGQQGNGLLLTAQGDVAHLERAFGVHLYTYVRGNRSFVANAEPVELPAGLAPGISNVSGLDTGSVDLANGIQGARGLRDTSHAQGRGLSPANLQQFYDISPLRGANLDGSGQTIALFELSDYRQSNVDAYDRQYQIWARTPQRVSLSFGGSTAQLDDGESEVELDIEVAQAIAPRAQILVYEGPQGYMSSIFNQIVSENRASIISISWGNAEVEQSASRLQASDQIFKEAAAQGQTMFAASGDAGAYDAAPNHDAHAGELAVDFPASDPWVTGVGGTTLTTNSSALYDDEMAWGDHSRGSGSGGGLSRVFTRPTYQTGPGVLNGYSNGMRQVPDVSADADPRTGYWVYITDGDSTGWTIIGGTSAAAPLWAAYVTLATEYLGKRVGFLNPTLYRLGAMVVSTSSAPFNDVTTGDNLYYRATSGWDFATGWGSMDGATLLSALTALPSSNPSSPQPTPTQPPVVNPTQRPAPAPAISVDVKVWTGVLVGTRVRHANRVHFGQTLALGFTYTVNSMPDGTAFTREYTLMAPGGLIVLHKIATGTIGAESQGRSGAVYTSAFVPKETQRGVYTFVLTVKFGSETRKLTTAVKLIP